MAESQDDHHYPTARRQQIAATLLEVSFRLGEGDRRRLQIDLVDIADRKACSHSTAGSVRFSALMPCVWSIARRIGWAGRSRAHERDPVPMTRRILSPVSSGSQQ